MAINNTGAMFKSFEFDGTDSRNFGVYITGAAVYDAPEREVEMISIPNRNGAFALDKGRFENIEITYPAGIYADTEADFAEAISDLRNFLCSKRGYCRLTDEYNPNEYRMAIYKSGLEVEPTLLKAGEFEITFECMPQRFLTSGETKTTLTSPATITNPTLFDSKPMFEVEGYGNIGFNGFDINIGNGIIGNIILQDNVTQDFVSSPYEYSIPIDMCNVGDAITVENISVEWVLSVNGTLTSVTGGTKSGNNIIIKQTIPDFNGVVGTNRIVSDSFDVDALYSKNGTSYTTHWQWAYTCKLQSDVFTIKIFDYAPNSDPNITLSLQYAHIIKVGVMNLDSTLSILGHPIYIDCDSGNAYKYENGQLVSLNSVIDLGSDLPVLKSGTNTITFDNTFTQVDLIPRWWQV